MSCDLWAGLLDTYADDSCSPEELAGIEEHLRTCPACAAAALARVQAKRMNRLAAIRYTPSPEFQLRIESSIRRKQKPLWALGIFGRTAWMPRLAAVTLALALIVVSVAFWTRHAAREQDLAELLDVHVATLASANPVDVVSTDRHTVKPWFQGKLPFTFNLPELQDSPFKLLGGKLIYFEHSPGAQLLFETRKHQLSVFILQDQAAMQLPGAGARRERGFSVETWSHAGLRYVVISDTNPTDIHALSELLRTAAGQ
jgi:anti-sigma factor RsiW